MAMKSGKSEMMKSELKYISWVKEVLYLQTLKQKKWTNNDAELQILCITNSLQHNKEIRKNTLT
jgi:hypothetical protein